jgi:ribosomal-protein-alanine N-acetyltransferase
LRSSGISPSYCDVAGPFSFHDWTSDPEDLAELLDPHGARLEMGLGLGLHPEWTGQGFGKSFLEAGLEYARRRFAPMQFTLSVASFNRRAITVYERAGFAPVRVFTH